MIAVCKHTRDDLQETLDTIETDFDRDFPDFREALEAGVKRHDGNRCDDDAEATPTPDRHRDGQPDDYRRPACRRPTPGRTLPDL